MDKKDYFNELAINQSSIKDFIADKEDFWDKSIFNPQRVERKKTPSMALGTLYHDIIEKVLTGDNNAFDDKYAIVDNIRRGSKKWEELVQDNIGKVLIKQKDYDSICNAVDHLFKSDYCKDVILENNIAEKEVYWQENITVGEFESEIPCKAKIDMYNDDYIVDWKSTRAESPEEFEIEVNKYKYYLQSAWYSRAVMRLDKKPIGSRKYLIIAQCLKKPHIIMRYDFGIEQIKNLDNVIMEKELPEIKNLLISKKRELYLKG